MDVWNGADEVAPKPFEADVGGGGGAGLLEAAKPVGWALSGGLASPADIACPNPEEGWKGFTVLPPKPVGCAANGAGEDAGGEKAGALADAPVFCGAEDVAKDEATLAKRPPPPVAWLDSGAGCGGAEKGVEVGAALAVGCGCSCCDLCWKALKAI